MSRMDSKELVAVQRVPVLEKGSYGLWKMKMEQIIKSISEDAWGAVEDGWSAPTTKGDEGKIVPKPRNLWTDLEREQSRMNSKALVAIFGAVSETQYMRIQGCKSAKDAWDRLQSAYEGSNNVKTTRLDMLASKFENIKMNESESIEEFSAKLSCIAGEAEVLGKRYKDKKMVKKLLRSLPAKFDMKKTAMCTSLDTNSMGFEEAVGHLQSFEMELRDGASSSPQTAFVSEDRKKIEEMQETMALMARKFKTWKRDFKKNESSYSQARDKNSERGKKEEARCHECQGFGHFKAVCPTAKKKESIKCYTCKGYGHISSECCNNKEKDKSYSVISDSDTESEDDCEPGFVAFPVIIEDESDSDEESISDSQELQEARAENETEKLYESWVLLGREKLELLTEKMELTEQVEDLQNQLKKEQQKNVTAEDLKLVELNKRLNEELNAEREKSAKLEAELHETMKKIHMLNSGTKELNKILGVGRSSKTAYGLGYNGESSSGKTVFVKATNEVVKPDYASQTQYKARTTSVSNEFYMPTKVNQRYACYFCGKNGHYKRNCYFFHRKIQRLSNEGKVFPNKARKYQVWIAKKHLFENTRTTNDSVAFLASKNVSGKKWYFDSGASRHMTGDKSILTDYVEIEESKVTFGGGAPGIIKGKGKLNSENLPNLESVYYVQGLKPNLISVNQLCDDGFSVAFNGNDCVCMHEQKKISLRGTRAGNDCFMWEQEREEVCFKTETEIHISQTTYAERLVERFGMSKCKAARTPMSTTVKLSKDSQGDKVDQTLYRGMIGSLLYLSATRPDISLSVGLCARYQADPRESHLTAVKRIVKYVKGTMDYGLNYTKDTNVNLVGFCDADWAGSLDDRKSTSGGCFYLGNNLIAWHCRKQNCVSLSTAEAEYIAMGSCCTQLLWMKQMAQDYGVDTGALLVNCDNKSAIDISKNPVQHSRTKHIDIRHHFIRELVEENVVELKHVSSERQLADIFTKPLDHNTFVHLRKALGICELH